MDSVRSSDTDGGESFLFLVENDCWRSPGWKEDLKRPKTCLQGTGSEQPQATGCTPRTQPTHFFPVYLFVQGSHYHISLYFCAKKL